MALASEADLPSSKRERRISASSRKISRSIAQDNRSLRDLRYSLDTCIDQVE
jgi:hypothetical protein